MTSPSRRKRPTTAQGPTTAARTPAEWAAVALAVLLAGAGGARAQSSYNLRPLPAAPTTLTVRPAPRDLPGAVTSGPPVPISVPSAPTVQVPGGVSPARYQMP